MRVFLKTDGAIREQIDDWYSVTFRSSLNRPGGWTLEGPFERVMRYFAAPASDTPPHSLVLQPDRDGAGIVIQGDDGVFEFSGVRHPVKHKIVGHDYTGTTVRTVGDPEGVTTISGPDDLGFLRNRVYIPGALVGGEHPSITGNPGVEVPDLVESQIGAAATANRRLPGWSFDATSVAGGSDVTVQPAYGDLLTTARQFLTDWDGPELAMRCTQGWEGVTFSCQPLEQTPGYLSLDDGVASISDTFQATTATHAYVVYYDSLGDLQVYTSFDTSHLEGYDLVEKVSDLTGLQDGAAASGAQITGAAGGLLSGGKGGRRITVTLTEQAALSVRVGQVVNVKVVVLFGATIAQTDTVALPVVETVTNMTNDGRVRRTATLGQPVTNPLLPSQADDPWSFAASR